MAKQSGRKKAYNFIDLFAGAGGLSEGFIQAGFKPVAHVEMNEYASMTLETRSAYYALKENNMLGIYQRYITGGIDRNQFLANIPKTLTDTVINETMSDESQERIFNTIDGIMKLCGISDIDVIIGGPPCQAYSLVGRAQSSHMEVPMEEDPRNYLYILYGRFLKKYHPKMFVFENVAGIVTARNGEIWRNMKKYLRRVGYEIDYKMQNARDFGVLQNRKRMIIVGWLKGTDMSYPEFDRIDTQGAVVNDLFSDLPILHPGAKGTAYLNNAPSNYVVKTGIRTNGDVLTEDVCRPNIDRDIEIYKRAINLWNNGHQRLKYNDLPEELKTHKNRHSFVDRFKVVEGDMPYCHTVLAHLAKDGHYFIHPDINQHRSITVREAARLQSFPDSYYFEGPRTAQYVQIGNAVPPLMAKGIALGIKKELYEKDAAGKVCTSA